MSPPYAAADESSNDDPATSGPTNPETTTAAPVALSTDPALISGPSSGNQVLSDHLVSATSETGSEDPSVPQAAEQTTTEPISALSVLRAAESTSQDPAMNGVGTEESAGLQAQPTASQAVINIAGSTYISSRVRTVAYVSSQSITVGGAPAHVDGQIVSAAAGGVVVGDGGGATIPSQLPARLLPQQSKLSW